MAKLIRSSVECGHKTSNLCLFHVHQSEHTLDILPCEPKKEDNFPIHCPLEEGIPIEKNSEGNGRDTK